MWITFARKITMMTVGDRMKAFAGLGEILSAICRGKSGGGNVPGKAWDAGSELAHLVEEAHQYNGWFTEDMVRHMVCAIAESLSAFHLETWIAPYRAELEKKTKTATVGVVMAGNIPLVGFHDFLTVLIAGHSIAAKLSSEDDRLLPAVAEILLAIEPRFEEAIRFVNGKLERFDAIIATGSNNSARYFNYYFGRYPHVIRNNRNGVAVLTGSETEDDLNNLADDIFLYYGLGCRSVSRLFVPSGYDFDPLLKVLASRKKIAENHKFFNNYEYNKAIYLVSSTPHLDCGNLILVESEQYASPVSVLNYSYYRSLEEVSKQLADSADEVQCIVSNANLPGGAVPLGQSQQPGLGDYADGVDTMRFLIGLK